MLKKLSSGTFLTRVHFNLSKAHFRLLLLIYLMGVMDPNSAIHASCNPAQLPAIATSLPRRLCPSRPFPFLADSLHHAPAPSLPTLSLTPLPLPRILRHATGPSSSCYTPPAPAFRHCHQHPLRCHW